METSYRLLMVSSWIIVVGSFLGGLGLLLFPKFTISLNRVLSRSFSIEGLERVLNKHFETDRWVIAHRVIVGIIALAVSIITFFLIRA